MKYLLILLISSYFFGCKNNLSVDPQENFTDTTRVLKEKIFFTSDRNGSMNIYMMDLDYKNIKQLTHYTWGEYRGPRISPDGKKLLYYRFDSYSGTLAIGIYIKDIYSKDPEKPIIYGTNAEFCDNGNSIIFSNRHIYKYNLLDSSITQLTSFNNYEWDPSISRDGRYIGYTDFQPISDKDTTIFSHWDIVLFNLDSKIRTYIEEPKWSHWYNSVSFSPVSDEIVYVHHSSYDYICVQTLEDTLSRKKYYIFPSEVLASPTFSLDGDKIYFQNGYKQKSELYLLDRKTQSVEKITNNNFIDEDPIVQKAYVYKKDEI
jgi:Tol biopolymer transport system component